VNLLCAARLRVPCIIALVIFVASLAVYASTAARTVYWGDSAEFVAAATTLGIAHPPGYPLYTLLGAVAVRLPFGTPFLRMSMLSALLASGAAAAAALTAWLLAGRRRSPAAVPPVTRIAASLLAGGALAFGPTFWSQAVVPEVYALSAFLSLAALFLFVLWDRARSGVGVAEGAGRPGTARIGVPGFLTGDRPVLLLGLLLGFALANHLTAVFLALPVAFGALAVRRRPSFLSVLASLALFAVAISVYAYVPLRAAHDPAILWAPVGTPRDFVDHLTGAQYAPLLFAAPAVEVAHKLREFFAGLPSELTWVGLGLAATGTIALVRRARVVGGVVVAWSVLVVAHAAVYRIPDIASYYIPVYAVLAIAGGVGLAALASASWWKRASSAAPWLAVALAVAIPAWLVWSGWSENDRSRSRGCRDYVSRVLDSIEPGGVVVTMTDHVLFPLWHARYVERSREDFHVMAAREYAPHLERWCPEVRFPSETELCSAFESRPSGGEGPARDSVPVGNYLPLLFSLNAGLRPFYTDAELALALFADRSLPRGVLVELSPTRFDSLPEGERDAHDAMWRRVLREAGRRPTNDARTVEVYAKTLAMQGMLMLERGDTESAVDALERATALAPRIPLCHSNLGVAYERSGRHDDALSQFEIAIDLNPGLAAPHHNIAVASRRAGESARAEKELGVAVALEPDNPFYRTELAALLEERGEYDRAEALFESASRIAGEEWGASLAYGDFLRRRRRYSEAVAAYQRVVELMPGSAGALTGLGRCYWALDDRTQALEVMSRLVELQPHNPAPKFDLAVMLHRSGRGRQAVGLLDDVIRILPNMWEARALKASILGELGRYWEARGLFEEALEAGATGPLFWETWISMEASLGDAGMEDEIRGRAATAAGLPQGFERPGEPTSGAEPEPVAE